MVRTMAFGVAPGEPLCVYCGAFLNFQLNEYKLENRVCCVCVNSTLEKKWIIHRVSRKAITRARKELNERERECV